MKRFLALDQGLCFVLEDLALVFLEKKSSLISLSSLMNRRQPLSHMSNSLSLPSPHYMSELYRPIFSINTVPSVGIFSWGPIPWPVPVTSPEKQEGYKGEKFQSQTISDPPEPQINVRLCFRAVLYRRGLWGTSCFVATCALFIWHNFVLFTDKGRAGSMGWVGLDFGHRIAISFGTTPSHQERFFQPRTLLKPTPTAVNLARASELKKKCTPCFICYMFSPGSDLVSW